VTDKAKAMKYKHHFVIRFNRASE